MGLSQTREEINARCWELYNQAKLAQGTATDLVTAEGYHVKGELLFGLARYEDSIAAYSRALEIRKSKLPSRDPLIALTMVDLGLPYKRLGQNPPILSTST